MADPFYSSIGHHCIKNPKRRLAFTEIENRTCREKRCEGNRDIMAAKEFSMPLRDHFRPPVSKKSSWEGFHALWPTCIVQQLRKLLPPGFVAEPRVHLGTLMEIDVGALESDDSPRAATSTGNANGGAATVLWTGAPPAVTVETEPANEYEYAVQIFDLERERKLVAAIEFVSPANKDRPESRDAFVAKCASLLRKGVAVSVVDLVTIRRFNLYTELMVFIGHPDPAMTADGPPTYAASCRWMTRGTRARLESWPDTMTIGQPLPKLPLWLADSLVVSLELEESYEQACHDLWIT